jgi:hypothetical protein
VDPALDPAERRYDGRTGPPCQSLVRLGADLRLEAGRQQVRDLASMGPAKRAAAHRPGPGVVVGPAIGAVLPAIASAPAAFLANAPRSPWRSTNRCLSRRSWSVGAQPCHRCAALPVRAGYRWAPNSGCLHSPQLGGQPTPHPRPCMAAQPLMGSPMNLQLTHRRAQQHITDLQRAADAAAVGRRRRDAASSVEPGPGHRACRRGDGVMAMLDACLTRGGPGRPRRDRGDAAARGVGRRGELAVHVPSGNDLRHGHDRGLRR